MIGPLYADDLNRDSSKNKIYSSEGIEHHKEGMSKEKMKLLKKIYNQKNFKVDKNVKEIAGFLNSNLEEFVEWYDDKQFEAGCYYCGTTNEMSIILFEIQRSGLRLDATRGGKRLELDRLDPNQPNDNLNNLVWCCYWCNNAKSNFFTVNEFKSIGIGKLIKRIISVQTK